MPFYGAIISIKQSLQKGNMYTIQQQQHVGKESIHSGQFMVSHFEAEEQDDEDNVAVPIPDVPDTSNKSLVPVKVADGALRECIRSNKYTTTAQQQLMELTIENNLSKVFQCMSLAYRQKLTSPKWNRFRGIRLRWKDKIRLNNVIWRCWHLQFIKKRNTLICQFASPLDVDTHNKPEAVVLEGKYWKRKLQAVTAEYKKWRLFYRNNSLGNIPKESSENLDLLPWDSNSSDNMMMVDEDYMGLMSDTLFSTISNQPFVFPDSREIARAGLADFIQPSLGPLQPNLEDYMDTFDPLQDFINNKLPTVPEENNTDQMYKSETWGFYEPTSTNCASTNLQVSGSISSQDMVNQYNQYQSIDKSQYTSIQDNSGQPMLPQTSSYADIIAPDAMNDIYSSHTVPLLPPPPPPPLPYSVKTISKPTKTQQHNLEKSLSQEKLNTSSQGIYKTLNNMYSDYQQQQQQINNVIVNDIQVPLQPNQDLQPQFKLPQSSTHNNNNNNSRNSQSQHQHQSNQQTVQSQGYKFTSISTPNMKFTSHQVPTNLPQSSQFFPSSSNSTSQSSSSHNHYNSLVSAKEEKQEPRRRGAPRGRQRSRSNTREPIKRPPLLSAASVPALLPPNSPTGSVLLTQLLSTNSDGTTLYNTSQKTLGGSHDHIHVKEESASNPIPILPQPPPHTTIIIPAQITTVQQASTSSVSDPLSLPAFSNSSSPILDSTPNLHSPTSSQGSIGSPNRTGDSSLRDRRVGHIHAEQKRRYNIKNGFDMIHSLIPHLQQNPNAKLSKAAMLQKGAEYIRQLKAERNQLKDEMDQLRQQIETLNTSISNCQSMLPATGAPVSRRRDSKMQEMFDEYVRTRTMENWKFWIFSLIFRPLLNSFNNFVSTSSLDDLYTSTMLWIEQHCTLVDLRPVVFNSLRYLSRKTDILSHPDELPNEARQIVCSNNHSSSSPST